MAVTQTGSQLDFSVTTYANTGTVSTTITVPSDAEIVVVGWSGFGGSVGYFSGGSMTFTKGGADTAMIPVTGADANSGLWQGAVFYLTLPDTGSNKSLKFDWAGAALPTDRDGVCSVLFFKGIDTAIPVRSSRGVQASALPYTTPTLPALTGDLIVAWVSAFASAGEGTVDTWSNLTLLGQCAKNTFADAAWATGSPTGYTAVAASTGTNLTDGGITAIVLRPSGATDTVDISQTANPAGVAASSNVATYSAQPIGAVTDDRIIVICVGTELASSVATAATIDYGGGHTAMTAGSPQALGGGAITANTFYLLVPTGTTAEFKVTFGATNPLGTQNHIAVYRVIGSSTGTVVASGVTDTDADPISTGAVTVPALGGMLAICADATDSSARTWTGLTEDIDADAGTFRFSTGFLASESGGSITATVSGANGEDGAISYLVFTANAADTIVFPDMFSSSMLMPTKHNKIEVVGY